MAFHPLRNWYLHIAGTDGASASEQGCQPNAKKLHNVIKSMPENCLLSERECLYRRVPGMTGVTHFSDKHDGGNMDQFIRTRMVLGDESVNLLSRKRVCVFGCGGVGGYVVESLARSGIGSLDIVDGDVVDISNLNRQIIALHSTLGMNKATVMEKRIHDINPDAQVKAYGCFYNQTTAGDFDFSVYDYVVDAIDSVRDKLDIIERCVKENVPIISSMGAGKKTDPSLFKAADIYETSVCPLARVMRRELKKRGIRRLKVVYSTENVNAGNPAIDPPEETGKKRKLPMGSVAWIPAVAGLMLGKEVIMDLLDEKI